MRLRVFGTSIAVASVLCAVAVQATAADATQNLVSPLGAGTGISFAASRTKEQISLGIEQQFQTFWVWNLALQAGTDDKDAAKFFTIGTGGESGAALKLGVGSSTFPKRRPDLRDEGCGVVVAEYACLKNAEAIASDRGVSDAGTCDEILQRIAGPPSSGAPATTPPKRKDLVESVTTALKDAKLGDPAKKALAQLQALFAPKLAPADTHIQRKGCEPIGREATGYLKEMYQDKVARFDRKSVYFRWNLSGLFSYTPIDYRPKAADGTVDFKSEETWRNPLPGVVLDGTLYKGPLIAGLSLRAQRLVNADLSEVCEAQTSGAFTARQCSKAQIGAPKPYTALGATLAVSLNPLIDESLGGVRPGIQLLTDFSTVNGGKKNDGSALFENGSYQVIFSAPIFLAGAETPWGSRAGIAPQYLISTSEKGKNEVQFLLFVGTSFDGLTIPK